MHAKAHQGQWILRIDDLDTPRNVSGATECIIETLQHYGLHWQGDIQFQSDRLDHYEKIIALLRQQQLAYPCSCSRKQLAGAVIYPQFCREQPINTDTPHALRIKTHPQAISFDDELQGHFCHDIAEQHGDFIIKRKDNITAYQLAVVIDDYQQNISHVVRGFDLIEQTPKQLYLQSLLGYPAPTYCHVPIITHQNGEKLSKQTCAEAVSQKTPQKTLFLLLELLKQKPPNSLKNASVTNTLDWAAEHWQIRHLRNIQSLRP